MTDVEASTPGKRKSFSNKQGRKDSPKKFAPDTKTPQKVKLNKGVTPKKQNNSPNKQNSTQKPNKKSRQNSESDSPKKLKPFAGTSNIQTPSAEKINKKGKSENTANSETQRRKKKGQFYNLSVKVKSGEKEVVKTLDEKIKAIESRDELTKTAKRKLKILIRMKNAAEGKPPGHVQQAKSPNSKSVSSKRHDRKKKALLKAKELSGVKTSVKPGEVKTNGKANQKGKPGNKQVAKKPKLEAKVDDESDDESDEEESDEVEEESGAEEEDKDSEAENAEEESEDEVEGEDSDEGEEDSDEGEKDSDESDEEEESEEETPPQEEENNAAPRKKIKREKTENETKNRTVVNLDELKKSDLVGKNQKRFVLFVGNIPYDTNKVDLIEHFKKCGEIKHIRIPTEKKSSKPRGFAYVEVGSEETYQKCLSMHHSFLKGRRINVLYTQGGKKKGEEKKKEIKAKNFKLHAMRKQGQLLGSKKETQKRSFRRAKQRKIKSEQEPHD